MAYYNNKNNESKLTAATCTSVKDCEELAGQYADTYFIELDRIIARSGIEIDQDALDKAVYQEKLNSVMKVYEAVQAKKAGGSKRGR